MVNVLSSFRIDRAIDEDAAIDEGVAAAIDEGVAAAIDEGVAAATSCGNKRKTITTAAAAAATADSGGLDEERVTYIAFRSRL